VAHPLPLPSATALLTTSEPLHSACTNETMRRETVRAAAAGAPAATHPVHARRQRRAGGQVGHSALGPVVEDAARGHCGAVAGWLAAGEHASPAVRARAVCDARSVSRSARPPAAPAAASAHVEPAPSSPHALRSHAGPRHSALHWQAPVCSRSPRNQTHASPAVAVRQPYRAGRAVGAGRSHPAASERTRETTASARGHQSHGSTRSAEDTSVTVRASAAV
jgi:hypothetical protein